MESVGIEYSAANTYEATVTGVEWLTDLNHNGPRVLEVFSEKLTDIAQLKAYYSTLTSGAVKLGAYARVRKLGGRVLRRLGLR